MKLIKITAIWCMSCIFMNEVLKTIEKDQDKNYETVELDYDLDEAEVKGYDIGNILPVYILFDNNQEIARSSGEKSKKELIEFFNTNGAFK